MGKNGSVNDEEGTVHFETAAPKAETSDLWLEVGRDFDHGISETAKKLETTKERLLALLIAESFNDSGTPLFPVTAHDGSFATSARFRGLVTRHWPDMLILVVLPLLVFGLAIRGLWLVRQKRIPQLIARAPGGVPAFHFIKPDDLKLEERPEELHAVTSLDKAVGHYSLETIVPGAVLHENQIISDERTLSELKGRSILRLTTKTTSYKEAMTSVTHVTLMFSGGQSSQDSTLVKDVILLGVDKRESNVLILAVTDDQLQSMRGFVGRLDVFVLQ
ncbi:MAG: hypothetical protein QOH70_674 [Blastocatellia bacterium]|jgi:hypothetical protein|nr:hypothetical protein [Blastocatellia bacterium]